jgi:DeoR/GlpR family transcriptional regulator of sugar metabolism
MRKADYLLLASLLQEKRDLARKACNGMNPNQDLVAATIGQTALDLARDFARLSKLNAPMRAEFLALSGID